MKDTTWRNWRDQPPRGIRPGDLLVVLTNDGKYCVARLMGGGYYVQLPEGWNYSGRYDEIVAWAPFEICPPDVLPPDAPPKVRKALIAEARHLGFYNPSWEH